MQKKLGDYLTYLLTKQKKIGTRKVQNNLKRCEQYFVTRIVDFRDQMFLKPFGFESVKRFGNQESISRTSGSLVIGDFLLSVKRCLLSSRVTKTAICTHYQEGGRELLTGYSPNLAYLCTSLWSWVQQISFLTISFIIQGGLKLYKTTF